MSEQKSEQKRGQKVKIGLKILTAVHTLGQLLFYHVRK